MTREKAIKKAWTKDIEDFIDEIYDDFESRICENCKHSQERSLKTYYSACTLNKFMTPSKDFGCNKFTVKNNK